VVGQEGSAIVSDRAISQSHAPSPTVVAIVLAAGMSRRMGRAKALLPIGDEAAIHRVVRNLVEAGSIGRIIVVTGHDRSDVEAALSDLDVTFTHNSIYDAGGMLSSIQAGIRAAGGADGVVIALGDQPLIQPDTVRAIVVEWKSSRAALVIPTHQGKRGHPVFIDRAGLGEVLALGSDETLKTFVTRHEPDAVELAVKDAAVIADMDTPEEYERMLEQQKVLDGGGRAAVKQPAATASRSSGSKGHDHV